MKLIIPLFIIILFSFTLVSAQLDIGEENIDSVGVNILKQPQVFNNGTAFVNASNYWITSEGILGDVSDILHNWLSNLEWSVAGHTMDADLDMNQNDIIDVKNVTASWFNGKFNWTSISHFLTFDGSSLDYNETALNESIDARTISRYYNATTIDTIEGTYDSGDIYSIQIPEDGDTYNVSEDVGANPLLINVNFTNISDFNMIVGRIYYKGGQGHKIQLEIYRVDTEVWENYEEYTDMTDYVNIHVPIFDSSNHIDATGNVSVRFDHFQNGLPNHEFSIDYLNLVDGWTTLTTADHDGLSGRNLITNHPQYLDTDATRNVTGNLTLEQNLFVDGNITTINWFNGLFNWTTLTNWLSFDGAKLIFNETKLNETIDNRATGLGDNESWNESYADTRYGGGIGNASWNESYANTIYLMNNTFNVTYHSFITNVSTNYTEKTVEGYDTKWSDTYNATYALYNDTDLILSVNTTANVQELLNATGIYSTYNSTYDSYSANVSKNWTEDTVTGYDTKWYQVLWDATFNTSFLDRFNSLFSAKDTDDLSEGSINLYDNVSWNESFADTKYGMGDNVSWNESYGNTLYLMNNTFNATYHSYGTNVSTNYTENTVTGYDTRWLDGNVSWNESYANTIYLMNNTFNATYDSYSTNVSLNYSELVFTTWDSRWYQVLWDAIFNSSFDDRISSLGDNESWNESYGNTKYLVNNTFNATYDSYQTNVSTNYTENTVTGYDTKWSDTSNTTYESYATNVSRNYTEDTFNAYDARWLDGNVSWNESYADTRYSVNNTFNATYDSYATNVSTNYTENTVTGYDTRWYQVLWDAVFNASFDDRDSEGNVSWNESYGNTLYLMNNTFNTTYHSFITNVSTNYTENTVTGYNTEWTSTYNTTYHSFITNVSLNYSEEVFNTWDSRWTTAGNVSWNESYANTIYLINNTYNATYDAYSTNVSTNWSELTFDTWDSRWIQNLWDAVFNASLTDFFNTLFDSKDTDDLSEGSTNLYDNQSWNESYGDSKYSGNASWNESYANTIYLMNNTYNATYHSFITNVSTNYTENTVTGYDARWLDGNVSWNESYGRDIFIENASNLTIGDSIIFRLGEVIDNLIDGWVTVTGNLQVDGNVNVTGEMNITNNVTLEGVKFEVDSSNHRIYDNASCIIMQSGTTELRVCE